MLDTDPTLTSITNTGYAGSGGLDDVPADNEDTAVAQLPAGPAHALPFARVSVPVPVAGVPVHRPDLGTAVLEWSAAGNRAAGPAGREPAAFDRRDAAARAGARFGPGARRSRSVGVLSPASYPTVAWRIGGREIELMFPFGLS